jgi:GntR family transcriptional regulator
VEYGRRLREEDLYRYSLVRIFDQILGVVFGDAIQTIEATFATDEVAELLEVPFGAPVLHVERLMRDEAGAPVEVVKSCYRADRYRYMATLVRGRGEPFRWQYKSNA